MDFVSNRATTYSALFLRMALGISFLSAVADRFGLWALTGDPMWPGATSLASSPIPKS